MKPSKQELAEEEKRLRYLRYLVDMTTAVLSQGNLSIPEALDFIARTKKIALTLFPDSESTYDLIYKPRFERIIKERLQSN